jgi:uncharacterized coiled-coil DUF342 family protein
MGALDCAGLDVCGVAFECNDSVCTLSRDVVDQTPKETTFVFSEKHVERAAIMDEDLVAVPIVKMSEIRANPELTLRNTDTATRRIRNASYKNVMAQLDSMKDSLKTLNESVESFDEVKNDVTNRLAKSLSTLENYNRNFMAKPIQSEEDRNTYRKLLYNLRRRNELFVTFLQYVRRVAEEIVKFAQNADEVKAITNELKEEFSQVDYAMQEP